MTPYITSISLGGTYDIFNAAGSAIIDTATAKPFVGTKLLFNFLSLQPEKYKKIASKNCVP